MIYIYQIYLLTTYDTKQETCFLSFFCKPESPITAFLPLRRRSLHPGLVFFDRLRLIIAPSLLLRCKSASQPSVRQDRRRPASVRKAGLPNQELRLRIILPKRFEKTNKQMMMVFLGLATTRWSVGNGCEGRRRCFCLVSSMFGRTLGIKPL